MSRIITVAGEKGGVLKSTTALLLADAAARAGHSTMLIQAGTGQGTAQRGADYWLEYASKPGTRMRKPEFDSQIAFDDRIGKTIKQQAKSYDVVIVDSGGGPGTEPWKVRIEAVTASDLVVMPVKRQPVDLIEARSTLETLTSGPTPVAVLLTLGAEKYDELARQQLTPLCDQMLTTVFPTRQAWADRYRRAPNTEMCAAADALWAEVEFN